MRFAAGGDDDVPREKRPIVLGRIRFPKQSGMTLETNSIERAIAITEYCDESRGRKPVGAGMSPLDRTTDGQVTAVPSES